MIKKTLLILTVALPLAWVASIFFMAFQVSVHGMPYQKAYDAMVKIDHIELALTKLLSDTGRGSLGELFEQEAFEEARAWYQAEHGTSEFEAEIALYSCGLHALLRYGRNAVKPYPEDKLLERVQQTFDVEVLALLDHNYMMGLGDDPWGASYRLYPGPWPEERGLVLFRDGLLEKPSSELTDEDFVKGYQPEGDVLTVVVGGRTPGRRGFAAPPDQVAYIWSFGANGVSDQPHYDPTHEYAPPARQHYRENTPEDYFGGGDDVNNWEEISTFHRFYK